MEQTLIAQGPVDVTVRLRTRPTGDPYLHALVYEAADEIDHLRETVRKLAALAQHSDGCAWITPLPTGEGYWGCDCGLNDLVLDGNPTDAALTPNVELTGAARLYRAASSDRRERG